MPQKPEIRDTQEGKADLIKHEQHLNRYYELRGYDQHGCPTPERLKELELEFVCQGLADTPARKEWDGPPMWELEIIPAEESAANRSTAR